MTHSVLARPAAWLAGWSLASTLLSACAIAPRAAVPEVEPALAGRLSVHVETQPPRRLTAAFELAGNAATGQLLLSSPLGTTAARAHWSPGSATLTTADTATEFADLEALTLAALGERIPLAALFEWLRGRPWPAVGARPLADGQPGFEQLGWQVSLARWSEGHVVINRLAPPAVTLRVQLEGSS